MVRTGVYILFWFGTMWACLQVQQLDLGHSLCGKWGCGPPAEAILGMHLFWFAVILPPSLLAMRSISIPWQVVGKLLAALSILVMIGFGIFDFFGHNRHYYELGYVWQRYLLSLGSLVDIPIVQLFSTGALMAFFGRGCPCCSESN